MRKLAVTILLGLSIANAQEPPPLEAYGALPTVDMLELSPDGSLFATRVTANGKDVIMVNDVATGEFIVGANAERVNPRWLNFVAEDYLVMVSSSALRPGLVGNSFEFSEAHSLHVSSSDVRTLLRRARGLYASQSGLGRIIGRSPDGHTVYMPAFNSGGTGGRARLGIYAVSLDKSRERLIVRGNTRTRDWFINEHGVPLVREDFDDNNNIYEVWAVNAEGKNKRLLYEEEVERPTLSLVGLTPDRESLVVLRSSGRTGVVSYYLMSIADGEITGPVLGREGLGIERVITDINRVVYGVEYEGFEPRYSFFDEGLDKRVDTIQKRLPGTSARLASWSRDFRKLAVEIGGGWSSGAYLMFEEGVAQPTVLARSRPQITRDHVALTVITEYEARDGLTIPALITVREDIAKAGKVPLVVMPHGGPEAHDRFEFDWMAQYFASRGAMVLQPQFRGSTGFGRAFVLAGRGEYGGKMRTDLEDGVKYIVGEGLVDPDRVCIVGASYGGYAALAAGAFSPELYSCVVAIAPVSDVRKMLLQRASNRGKRNWAIDYWEDLYGAEASDKDDLRSISPARNAESFTAPVLLLHGKKDTVVPPEQSRFMYKALKKADKDVTYVQLKGEDHWLSQSATRLEALQLIAAFIDEHL